MSQKKPHSYRSLCPVFYHSNVKVINTTVLPALTENVRGSTVHSQISIQALNTHQALTEEQPMLHRSIPMAVTNASAHQPAGESQASAEIHFHEVLQAYLFSGQGEFIQSSCCSDTHFSFILNDIQ